MGENTRVYRRYTSQEDKLLNDQIVILYLDPDKPTYRTMQQYLGIPKQELINRIQWLIGTGRMKFREKGRKFMNKKRTYKHRKYIAKPPPVIDQQKRPGERSCLACSEVFASEGKHNRLCAHCRKVTQETDFTRQ